MDESVYVYLAAQLSSSQMVTYVIIGITVVVSFYAWNNPSAMATFIMNPYRIHRRKEYFRFVTSGFIHNDHMHLLFNMISLYFFGIGVEHVFQGVFGSMGNVYYVALYLLAIVVSDIPTFLKNKDKSYYNSLGASGGVSAIVFAFIIFRPLADVCLFIFACLPGFIMGFLFVIFSYYQGKKANDNINHEAHLYGGLFGLVFCIILYPESVPEFLEQVSQWGFLR